MEILLHYIYVVAIKDSWATYYDINGKLIKKYAWEEDSPFELAMISFWNLVVVWLKVSFRSFTFILPRARSAQTMVLEVLIALLAATTTMAILQTLVFDGWYRPT